VLVEVVGQTVQIARAETVLIARQEVLTVIVRSVVTALIVQIVRVVVLVTDLVAHYDQHLLDGRGDYLLRKGELDDRCARRLIVEAHDLMKIQNRRVAWHIDTIAKKTQLDV